MFNKFIFNLVIPLCFPLCFLGSVCGNLWGSGMEPLSQDKFIPITLLSERNNFDSKVIKRERNKILDENIENGINTLKRKDQIPVCAEIKKVKRSTITEERSKLFHEFCQKRDKVECEFCKIFNNKYNLIIENEANKDKIKNILNDIAKECLKISKYNNINFIYAHDDFRKYLQDKKLKNEILDEFCESLFNLKNNSKF